MNPNVWRSAFGILNQFVTLTVIVSVTLHSCRKTFVLVILFVLHTNLVVAVYMFVPLRN